MKTELSSTPLFYPLSIMIGRSTLTKLFQLSKLVSEDVTSHAHARAFDLLKSELRCKLQVQQKYQVINFYGRLYSRGVGTNEIEHLAQKIIKSDDSRRTDRHKYEVRRLLDIRMISTKKQLSDNLRRLQTAVTDRLLFCKGKHRLNRLVQKTKKTESSTQWYRNRQNYDIKYNHLVKKYGKTT